jgi:hypothetical protein
MINSRWLMLTNSHTSCVILFVICYEKKKGGRSDRILRGDRIGIVGLLRRAALWKHYYTIATPRSSECDLDYELHAT